MISVKFTNHEEFLEELTLDKDQVEDKILRVCIGSHRPSGVPLIFVTVLASVIVRGKVVELAHPCGTHMGVGKEPEEVCSRANAIADKIREAAKGLGLIVRAGKFEENEK